MMWLLALFAVELVILVADSWHWIGYGERRVYATLIIFAIVLLPIVVSLARLAAAALFRRRRFQFSLRSLLLFALIFASACGWLARQIEKKRGESEDVLAIERAGGVVVYDVPTDGMTLPGPDWLRRLLGQMFFSEARTAQFFDDRTAQLLDRDWLRRIKSLDLVGQTGFGTMTDAGLNHLDDLTQLRELSMNGPDFTDAGLVHLAKLSQLQVLSVTGTAVTDAGLENFVGLIHLERLSLYNAPITGQGVASLKGLTQLHDLDLNRTSITDRGLASLAGLTQLHMLHLDDTPITDAGIVHFKGLTKLQLLSLRGTRVTESGAEDIHRALPNCLILFGTADEHKGERE